MDQTIQITGALLILAAFVLTQGRRMSSDSPVYLVLNVVGSGLLAFDAWRGEQWGFLLLETVWFLVSISSLIRLLTAGDRSEA